MNEQIFAKLDWQPLQEYRKLADVDRDHLTTNRSGLYIWGFMDDTKNFWPYYAGKHRNVPFRLCEHLSNLKGGNYTIYSSADLFKMGDNRFYQPHVLRDRVLFIDDKFGANQVGEVKNMIDRFHFTYCLMDNFTEFGDKAEKTVLNCFSKDLLINTIFGNKSENISVGNLFNVIDPIWDNRDQLFDTRFREKRLPDWIQ